MVHKNNCIVCGEKLVYKNKSDKVKCYFCKQIYESNVQCVNGHFICDNCHSLPANDLVKQFCIVSKSEDPIEMALILMRNEKIKMHGPEHHFLVPAVLLASYYNLINDEKTKIEKIEEAEKRAKSLSGGFCGFFGACAAGVGTGIFISLITNATPLSQKEWKLCNMMTSKSILTIANAGGPRCCKRNTFISIIEAVKFLNEFFGLSMYIDQNIICEFDHLNKECLKDDCSFNYPKER
ncbi:MAG: SAM-dependent methyltransferase [Candidatus Cloacimonetes bacterium]|nr:SAM-dependent methyltransferase [Candidatus Cloacimonadota bacterium]